MEYLEIISNMEFMRIDLWAYRFIYFNMLELYVLPQIEVKYDFSGKWGTTSLYLCCPQFIAHMETI